VHKKNEAILITAATRRIGLILVKALLKSGYSVILHYRTSRTEVVSWLKENREYSEQIHFVRQDLSRNTETLIDRAVAFGIPLVGLINNASVFTQGNLNDRTHFEEMLSIHLCIPRLLGSRFSALPSARWMVNITDAKISPPSLRFQNYRMSKLFLEELTRQQALLYAPRMRVNAVAPGAILPADHETRTTFSRLRRKIPLQTIGNTDALVQTLFYLIDNESITGQILAVDGGWHLTG